ncbi:MAG: phosphoglycerate kinase, partial [Thermaerobacter sp.]|nr:phosphoglycerate kinase [Thermaerobacter sp.]
PVDGMPDDWQALDIGPQTLREYEQVIARARSVFWNGPLGVFEVPGFEQGTYGVARAMAANPGLTVVGGGDATAAVRKAGVAERMSHLCTGGGAALKFLEGRELPGVACLEDAP